MRATPTLLRFAALAASTIAGCAGVGGSRDAAPAPAPTPDTGAASVVALPGPGTQAALQALMLVGTRYRYGGDAPDRGLDCSGLVRWVYREQRTPELPRTAWAMHAMDAPEIARDALAAGDLVFFRIGRRVSHVGLYVGDGRFVHAPGRGKAVRLDRLDDAYWSPRYAGARRPAD